MKSIGLDSCDEFYVQKFVELKEIADIVEKATVKEAKEMLEQIQGTSEAVPESVTMAEASEASAKVIQTSDLPTSIPTPLSPSNDSDHDEIPLGQKIKMLPKPLPKPFEPKYPAVLQSIGEMSQRRIDICNKL